MGEMILVTGGARSGKSNFAESLIKKSAGKVLYIATSVPFDEEMKDRVRRHKTQRPDNWITIEAYKDLDLVIESAMTCNGSVLLDCITIMVSNLMLEKGMDWEGISSEDINIVEELVKDEINKLIRIIKKLPLYFVIVTNELGMGVVPPTELGRAVRDIAGRANQMLAYEADEVYLCVSGIPVKIK
jgi:adenosylcobinamide kinase / adenosylcobinamide-phosphate guanylyltransferase